MGDDVYIYYHTRDGSKYFEFLLSDRGEEGWRIYILSDIDFKGQDDDYDETHRIESSTYDYICWSKRIDTCEQACAVATRWADIIALYIKGCGSFGTIARILAALD